MASHLLSSASYCCCCCCRATFLSEPLPPKPSKHTNHVAHFDQYRPAAFFFPFSRLRNNPGKRELQRRWTTPRCSWAEAVAAHPRIPNAADEPPDRPISVSCLVWVGVRWIKRRRRGGGGAWLESTPTSTHFPLAFHWRGRHGMHETDRRGELVVSEEAWYIARKWWWVLRVCPCTRQAGWVHAFACTVGARVSGRFVPVKMLGERRPVLQRSGGVSGAGQGGIHPIQPDHTACTMAGYFVDVFWQRLGRSP